MTGCKIIARRLAVLTAGLIVLLGCSQAPIRPPLDLASAAAPVARGQMAADLDGTPRLAIPEQPKQYDHALVQANPAAPNQAPAAPSDLHRLWQQAATHFAAVTTYTARLHRREQVNGKNGPDEWQLFKWRKQPWSVYLKWIGPAHQGREVLYVHGQHGGQIHTLLAAGDMPLTPAGKHIALAPDNIFVRSASRHAITEAGLGNLVAQFGMVVAAVEKGDGRLGTLRYLGSVRRPEYTSPLEAAEQIIPASAEAVMPRGGKRWWLFDSTSHLPVLVITADETGHEVEYTCYDQLHENVALTDADFDPAQWGR